MVDDEHGWKSQFPYVAHELPLESVTLRYIDVGPNAVERKPQFGNESSKESASTGAPDQPPNPADAVADHAGPGTSEPGSASETERPILLFVHGNPTWSFLWRNLIASLSHEYRCVAVDHIGCGRSDKPQEYDYTLATHIDNLSTLVSELDLRQVTLIAHDWGGPIGMGALQEDAARFDRIVLMNTATFPPPFIPWRIRACRIPGIGQLGVRGFNVFSRAALTMAVANPRHLDVPTKKGLLAPYDSWSNRVGVHRFVKDIPTSPRHPTWQRLESIEQGLAALRDYPVQLIWGMRDWCFRPSCLERLEEHFPHAEVTRLWNAGHYVLEDAPTEVLDALTSYLTMTDSLRRQPASDSPLMPSP